MHVGYVRHFLHTSANFSEWELLLVSYLSFKREGLERITEPVVMIRRDNFRFCLRMLCLPETPFEIKSLADVATAGVHHIEGARVVTQVLQQEGGPARRVLGCLVSLRHGRSGAYNLDRPQDHSWLAVDCRRSKLLTDNPADLEAFQAMFGGSAGLPCAGDDAGNSIATTPRSGIRGSNRGSA